MELDLLYHFVPVNVSVDEIMRNKAYFNGLYMLGMAVAWLVDVIIVVFFTDPELEWEEFEDEES